MSDDSNFDDYPAHERPTRDSIRGTCQSCAFYSRDGERAWWGTCDRKEDAGLDDDAATTTSDYKSCGEYKESVKVAEEAIARWRYMYGGVY